MFSKSIDHPLFSELKRGLFGYSGKLDFSGHNGVEITIKGRSISALEFTACELSYIQKNTEQFLLPATIEVFSDYQNIKDAVKDGEFDLESEGIELPIIENADDVWHHMILESICIEPNDRYQIRLGYSCSWDVEHDFGIYISNRKYEYSGVSV